MFREKLNYSNSKIKEITDKCISLESKKDNLTKNIKSKTSKN
ncbi:hypothetical protein RS022_06450 [Candidatus Phytoplasma rubi]|uniref:Uncharacterized protein n=1 Tax=Candidatus Phytoplasma rubi TaxID=399025 RepID=A0ABY7BS55_9MOLU|nr:hypothetical protein RS022_06450 [Candidatus Phytoplasma rubi]